VPSRPLVAVEARSAQHGAAGHQAAVTECSWQGSVAVKRWSQSRWERASSTRSRRRARPTAPPH